jgi:abequosyltransferase
MNHRLLSICIPTYNFGKFIGETLTSIINQATEDIDIVIVDGCSTDNTKDVVIDFQKMFPRLSYYLLDKKGGIDKDLARTVELAKGDYCWLLSSDDALKPGAVQKIINEIKLGYDIYLCSRTMCDVNLNPLNDQLWLSQEIHDQAFIFSSNKEAISYFNKAQSIGALFSFISSIVVRRDKWNAIKYEERFTGSNYAHVYRLFTIMLNGGKLKYLRDPLIFCRSGNDSFLESGLFKRYMIDIDGYLLLADNLFSDNLVKYSFLSVMQREHKWHHFAFLRSFAPDKTSWKLLERKLLSYGYPFSKLLIIRIISFIIRLPISRKLRTILSRYSSEAR